MSIKKQQIAVQKPSKKNVPGLYQYYHVGRNDERLGLFDIVRAEYGAVSFLYPGCFVHVLRRSSCPKLHLLIRTSGLDFSRIRIAFFVEESKRYRDHARLQFLWRDYTDELPISAGYDLLISQYGGFVSESCKRYLRRGGLLLANDSHGDAISFD